MKRFAIPALLLALLLTCQPLAALATDQEEIPAEEISAEEIPEEGTDEEEPDSGEGTAEEVPDSGEGTDEEEPDSGETSAEVEAISYDYQVTEGLTAETSALGLDADSALAAADTLSLDGEAFLLYDITSGTMLYADNIDGQREPASLTKLMTCLLALEYGDLDADVPVTESALSTLDPDGSTAGLIAGETYTLEQLLYCLMVSSSNDAALVIAEYIGGSQEAFVDMMNEEAQALGCTGTHFANPHGLHDDDHYSTARDLAKILMADMEYDIFEAMYSTTAYELPATNLQSSRTIYSTNYLVSTNVTTAYYDSRVTGGKTGFTTPAGRCVVCTATQDERTCMAVVLGAASTDSYGNATYGNFTSASALLDYAFDSTALTEILPENYVITSVDVDSGNGDAALDTLTAVTAPLPVGYDPSQISVNYSVYQQQLTAPVAQDTELGTVVVSYRGIAIGQSPLVAAASVKELSDEVQEALGNNGNSSTDGSGGSGAGTSGGHSGRARRILLRILLVILVLIALCVVAFLVLVIRARIIRARRRKRRRQRQQQARKR